MNSKKILFSISSAFLLLPVVALAAIDSIQSLMATLVNDVIWSIFVGIVVVCFLVSGILFLSAGGEAAKIQKAKASFLWGIAGVVVGILAYSIINIVEKALI